MLALDHTAQVPSWRQFTPYGAPRGAPAAWIDNRGFLNKPADTATGLTIIGARSYDPVTGRFTSPDPLLETTSPQQLNGYSYAAANPVTNTDPTGLMMLIPGPGGCYNACPPPPAPGQGPGQGPWQPGPGTWNGGSPGSQAPPAPAGSPQPGHRQGDVPAPPDSMAAMGCAGALEFKLGACPGEVRDVQEGFAASQIPAWELLLDTALAFLPVAGALGASTADTAAAAGTADATAPEAGTAAGAARTLFGGYAESCGHLQQGLCA